MTSKSKYLFICSKKHKWEAQACQIIGRSNRKGSWCPTCIVDAKKDNLETFKKIAKKLGGICISKKYINSLSKLEFQCAKGHRWKALPGNIKRSNTWCMKCSGGEKKDLEYFNNIAKPKGFVCISKKYNHIHFPMKWKCANKHIWVATGADISKGRGCPECTSGIGERVCRLYFEKIFKTKFPKQRPEWLSGELQDPHELDGYSKKLEIGFEHNGRQHYIFVKKWHINQSGFLLQQEKDKKRRLRCKANGVKLIEIPEINWAKGVSIDDLPSFLAKEFKKNKIKIDCDISKIKIDLRKVYSPDMIAFYQELAASKNGKLISNTYRGSKTKLSWRCEYGHIWQAPPGSIKNGNWCPNCIGRNGTIDEMKILAQNKLGKCLSNQYKNSSVKLKWECSEGHIWQASPTSIKFGSWCAECSNLKNAESKKLNISVMKLEAKKRGGVCLSKDYTNSLTKLKWRCAKGHIWESLPSSIRSGRWCPKCSKSVGASKRKDTIENMQTIAQKKNGICLSKKYNDSKTKLKWKCGKGHIWSATPTSVKHLSWCPICGFEKIKNKNSYSLVDLKKFASQNNGFCHAKKYVSYVDKVEWECQKGHRWKANFEYARFRLKKTGEWCTSCKKLSDNQLSS